MGCDRAGPFPESRHFVVSRAQHLDRPDPGHAFVHYVIHPPGLPEGLSLDAVQRGGQPDPNPRDQGEADEDDEPQTPLDADHEGDREGIGSQGGHAVQHGDRNEIRYGPNVHRRSRHQVSGLLAVVEPEVEALELVEKVVPQPVLRYPASLLRQVEREVVQHCADCPGQHDLAHYESHLTLGASQRFVDGVAGKARNHHIRHAPGGHHNGRSDEEHPALHCVLDQPE